MVYILCFKQKLHHAKHYVGYADHNVEARLKKHLKGHGAKLMKAVAQNGIDVQIARIWPDGDRNFERYIKNQKNTARYCPCCNKEAK
jgi:predicted GIY-YIG superfamily endonuclease